MERRFVDPNSARRFLPGNRDFFNAEVQKKGGPSIKMMMNILSSSANAAADRKMFFKTLIFNDLIYNTDSHAKNFSLFNLRVGYALTSMYDLLSAPFLKSMHQVRYENLKSSLKVNGKEKFIEITLTDWQAEATKCGLAKNIFEDIINEIQLSVKKMSIGKNQRPQSLDLNQLEQIFDGMQNRARLLLI